MPAAKAKQPKLTPKQALFVKGLAEGKTKVKAAMDAYPKQSYKSASVQAAQNLEKPSIKQAIEFAMGEHMITALDAVAPAKMALEYKGDSERDTVDMRLKGLYAYLKLAQFIEPKADPTSPQVHFHNHQGGQQSNYDL